MHHRHGHHGHQGHQGHHSQHMPHRFTDAASWSKQFDAPERDAWQKPDELVAALHVPADAVIADVGAGTGYFATRLARAAPQGRVLGVDVEGDMVTFIDQRAAKEGLANLQGRLTPLDRANLDSGTDLVLVVNTYHHISDRVSYFKAMAPLLSARGRVAIVDFRLNSERGPPRELKVSDTVVESELRDAGYVVVDRHAFLPDQYFVVFAVQH